MFSTMIAFGVWMTMKSRNTNMNFGSKFKVTYTNNYVKIDLAARNVNSSFLF